MMLLGTRLVREVADREMRLKLHGAESFLSLLKIRRELSDLSHGVDRIEIDLNQANLAGHTFPSRIKSMAAELGLAQVELAGLDEMRPTSEPPRASRQRGAA